MPDWNLEFSKRKKKALDNNIHIQNKLVIIRIDNRLFFITMIFTFIAAKWHFYLKTLIWKWARFRDQISLIVYLCIQVLYQKRYRHNVFFTPE